MRHTLQDYFNTNRRGQTLAQRFARHVSPLTTTVYTHPSDEELFSKIRTLTC